MLNFLFGRNLKDELYKTKKIKVCGVRFAIKKVNMLNYLDGSEVLVQKFDIHKTAAAKAAGPTPSVNKYLKHQKQILVAGVAEPKLVFDVKEDGVLVDDIFINEEMASELYLAILEYTYGKKKLQRLISQGQGLSK
jgi:hypothetical protein